jgi:beta-mannosidase
MSQRWILGLISILHCGFKGSVEAGESLAAVPLSGTDWCIHADAESKGVEQRLFEADASSSGWIPATVPGNIQADLEAAQQLNPLWYGAGDPRLADVASKDWWYRRDFVVPSSMKGQRLKLVFDGVDHECEVWLNGHYLGRHAGMYRRFGFDVAEFAKPGETNRLAVRISRIPEPLAACIVDSETRGGGKVNTSNKRICMMLKELKSPTNCAWDWAVAVYTLGIWKDVRLESTGTARIEWTRVQTDLSPDHSQATVKVRLEVDALDAVNTKMRLAIIGHGATSTSVVDAFFNAGTNRIEAELPLERPALWWPNGHGDQPLYQLTVVLEDAQAGQNLDTRSVRFGVRDIRWEQTPGTPSDFINPLKLVVNGRPVRQMGSNLIPPDSLFGRMEARGLRLLDLAHAAGINCLRLWGGGVTLSEAMYDRADELGLMLMQEFFLANYTPETDAVFLANLEATAINIVKQVRNHPSIVEWGGGNEMKWKNGDDHPALRVLEKVVREEDGRIFRATEPAQGSGAHGTYTYVYHTEPAPQLSWLGAKEQNLYQRYNNPGNIMRLSEFGCNSPANLEVWHREIPPASQWPLTNYEDPILIRKNVFHGAKLKQNWLHKELTERIFGPLDGLEDLVQAGQFLGAEGLRYAMDALRCKGPALGGGFMSWDYNEPWPNGAGSYMVDYDGRPLMNYDFVKQALTPVSLVLKYDSILYDPAAGLRAELFLVSDAPARVENLKWNWIARDRRGEIFGSGRGTVAIDPIEVKALVPLSIRPPATTAFGPIFVELRLEDSNGSRLAERLHVFGLDNVIGPFAGLLENRGNDSDDDVAPLKTGAATNRMETAWRPVRRTTLAVDAAPPRVEGETEILELRVKNIGSMTALFCEPHPLIEYRTDLFTKNNHTFIPPGESRTISIRASVQPKGGLSLSQTGWRLSCWNADDVIIEPDKNVLLAVGRRDQMCREFFGYFDKHKVKHAKPVTLSGPRQDSSVLPYRLDAQGTVHFEFAATKAQAKRPLRLRLHTADQSKDVATVVEVRINGKAFEQSLPKGLGLQNAEPAHLAFPSTMVFEIQFGGLRKGNNVMDVRVKNAGWFTWDSLDCVVMPKSRDVTLCVNKEAIHSRN